MKDRQKRPVHHGKDYVQQVAMENQQAQTNASKRKAVATEDLAAIAKRAEERAIRSERKAGRAWIVAIVSLIIAGLSLLVDVAGLFSEGG